MDLNTYIKQNQLNPNPYILAQLGATQELINYLLYTPWNTNLNIISSIGEGVNADCNHPELGELMYCGSASNKTIINADGTCDDGVQDGWCDLENWSSAFLHPTIVGEPCQVGYMMGVFDGEVVVPQGTTEDTMSFGDYLTISIGTDSETGNNFVFASELTGASHYALYTSADCIHTDLGCLYYCGGLQNGNIINVDGTHDVGTMMIDADDWQHVVSGVGGGVTATMVANGETITGAIDHDSVVAFGETMLEVTADPETGDPFVIISNAPSHYAIYFKED